MYQIKKCQTTVNSYLFQSHYDDHALSSDLGQSYEILYQLIAITI